MWDAATGAPLHNAIVWMDTRTQAAVDRIAAQGLGDLVRAKTGLPLASYFSALKLAWLLDEIPGARERAAQGAALFGTIDSWIIWNLTGGPGGGRHLIDATNASRTQLMNLETLQWDEELLRIFDIPAACLPKICSSSEVYGECVGALAGVPLAGALGDQHAALLGQACVNVGDAKNTYGTGCFLLMNVGETPRISTKGLLTTLAYQLGDAKPCYALEGSIAIAGALVQWLRDNLGIIKESREIEALARSVPDNGDVYFVPAFSGLFAPRWRGDARGIIAGLTRFSNKGHIARAALEAAAFQTREVLAAMIADAGVEISALKVDGGMAGNDLLMQFQADLIDAPVVRPSQLELTAVGAAYAAGLAVGVYKSLDDIAAHTRAITSLYAPYDAAGAGAPDRILGKGRRAFARLGGLTSLRLARYSKSALKPCFSSCFSTASRIFCSSSMPIGVSSSGASQCSRSSRRTMKSASSSDSPSGGAAGMVSVFPARRTRIAPSVTST